jgi:hypothetical protein
MTAKGSSNSCCCNGCEKPPEIFTESGVQTQIAQKWKRFCCSCIPEYMCVWAGPSGSVSASSSDLTTNEATIYKLYCPTSPEGFDQALYAPQEGGKLRVGSDIFDLTVHFIIVDDVCYLCLRSVDLGIDENTEGACVVIGAEERADPNFFCKRLSSTDAPMDNTTDKDLGEAGYGVGTEFTVGDYIFRISRANHIAILNRDACQTSYDEFIFDRHPIKNLCCNCGCVCKCMCLTVSNFNLSYSEVGCLYGDAASTSSSVSTSTSGSASNSASQSDESCITNAWIFPSGVVVSIGPVGPGEHLLVSCWSMDELSGTRFDSFGENDLFDTSGTSYAVGNISNAAFFDGSNWLMSPSDPTLWLSSINATISTWIYMDSTSQDMSIISKTSEGNIAEFAYKLYYDQADGVLRFQIGNGTDIFSVDTESVSAMTSQWLCVTCEIDNENKLISIILNNGASNYASFTGDIQPTGSDLYFGKQDDSADPQYFMGRIDQTYMFRRIFDCGTIDVGNNFWNGGDGFPCGDQTCYMRIENYGELDILTTAAAALIDPIENPCPRPSARWEVTVAAGENYPFTSSAYIEVACSSCMEDCSIPLLGCCANERASFPRVLTADVSTSCPSCPFFSLDMVWDGLISQWIGRGTMCGHSVELRIGCPFTSLTFFGSPCFSVSATDSGATCAPIFSTFEFNALNGNATGGIGCCTGSMSATEMTIVVYE